MSGEEVVEKLVRRYGWGTNKTLRKAAYERLGRLCDDPELGEQRVQVIATVVQDSLSKTDKEKYFLWVVFRRLMDRGLLERPSL